MKNRYIFVLSLHTKIKKTKIHKNKRTVLFVIILNEKVEKIASLYKNSKNRSQRLYIN